MTVPEENGVSRDIVPSPRGNLARYSSKLVRRGLEDLVKLDDDEWLLDTAGDGARILIVNDDRAQLESVEKVLASNGYEVQSVSPDANLKKTVHDFQPCVAILGLQMPGMGGVHLGVELSDCLPQTKIIFSSDHPFSGEELDELKFWNGCYRFDICPVSIGEGELLKKMSGWRLESSGSDLFSGFWNSRCFRISFDAFIANREQVSSLIFLKANETWDGLADRVPILVRRKFLTELGQCIMSSLEWDRDFGARYAESEFCLALPGVSKNTAEQIAKEICTSIARTDWFQITGRAVSLSPIPAVVSYPNDGHTLVELGIEALFSANWKGIGIVDLIDPNWREGVLP